MDKNADNLYQHFKCLDIEELVDIDIRCNSLNKKVHETKIFDNVIEYICDILYNDNYNENPFYSDYCYIREINSCNLVNGNNIKITDEFPIYVYITELDNNTLISVDNRDFSEIHKDNDIVIRINEKYLNNNEFNIYAGLKHEGLHALEMFILEKYNLLDLQKKTQMVQI